MSNTAKQLTDQDLLKIHANISNLSDKQQKGEAETSQVLEEAKKAKQQLTDTFDRDNASETRKAVWKDINDLIFLLEKEIGPQVGPNDALPISYRRQVSDVMTAIGRMENDSKSEQEVLNLIKGLNDYGKGIHKDHEVMKSAYAAYYARQAENYFNYANSIDRNDKRDAALKRKLETNLAAGKYTDAAHIQAVINKLS